jgi:hypothetical protein
MANPYGFQVLSMLETMLSNGQQLPVFCTCLNLAVSVMVQVSQESIVTGHYVMANPFQVTLVQGLIQQVFGTT